MAVSGTASASKTLATVLGAPLVAFSLGTVLVAFLPDERGLGLALGFHLMIPLWVILACTFPLAKSGTHAWARVLAVVVPMALLLIWRGLA